MTLSIRSKIVTFALLAVSCSSSEFAGSSSDKAQKSEEAKPKPTTPSPTIPPRTETPVPQPSPLEPGSGNTDVIIGGNTKVFRVGDGQAGASSCQEQLATSTLSGTTYIFGFDVVIESASVQISVDTLCGVSYDTNSIRLLQGSIPKYNGKLGKEQTSFSMGTLTLGKGHYEIEITSIRKGIDYDDFMVGNVRLRAPSGAVTPGMVTTR